MIITGKSRNSHTAVLVVSNKCRTDNQEAVMALQGLGLEATDDQRPVSCCVQVMLNSAQRRPLRQAGPPRDRGACLLGELEALYSAVSIIDR